MWAQGEGVERGRVKSSSGGAGGYEGEEKGIRWGGGGGSKR